MSNPTTLCAAHIEQMADIIKDIEKRGFTTISGRVLVNTMDKTVYAFYAIKRNELTEELDDCFFSAEYKDDLVSIRYKPIEDGEYFNV